jgi:hypothetical protein
LALQSPIRDAYTLGVQRNLVLSIRVIDFGLGVLTDTLCGLPTLRLGHLMRESGDGSTEWQGSLREIDHDLKELSAMRADADVRLTRIIAKRRQS